MRGYVIERFPARFQFSVAGISSIILILSAVFAWRFFVAVTSLPYLHEDQVFQYLEPAHRLVYGYGFIPWEYRFGLRNWLLPGFLAVVLSGFREIGIDQPRLYIPLLQVLGAVLSMTSVYSSYVIGKNLSSKNAGLLAAVFVGFWSELTVFSTALVPELLAMYCGLSALALWSGPGERGHGIAIGILVGLCAVLRLQFAPVSLVILLLLWHSRGWRIAGAAGASAIMVGIAAGVLDYFFWGIPFASFYNNVLFNFVYKIANTFGERTIIYYFAALAVHSLLLFALAGLYGLWKWRRFFSLLLVIGAVLIPHSLIGHKEYRFVVMAIPLLLILLACAATEIARLPLLTGDWLKPAHLVTASVALASAHLTVSKSELRRDPRYEAALFLSERPEVRSVVDFSSLRWSSGGYTYFHRNVPLLFPDDLSPAMKANLASVASHIIVNKEERPIAGYMMLNQFGGIKILSQVTKRISYVKPETDYRSPAYHKVDGKFLPGVSPWPKNDFRLKGN